MQAAPNSAAKYTAARALTVGLVLALLTALLAVLALGLGAVQTPAAEVVQVLLGRGAVSVRLLLLAPTGGSLRF